MGIGLCRYRSRLRRFRCRPNLSSMQPARSPRRCCDRAVPSSATDRAKYNSRCGLIRERGHIAPAGMVPATALIRENTWVTVTPPSRMAAGQDTLPTRPPPEHGSGELYLHDDVYVGLVGIG